MHSTEDGIVIYFESLVVIAAIVLASALIFIAYNSGFFRRLKRWMRTKKLLLTELSSPSLNTVFNARFNGIIQNHFLLPIIKRCPSFVTDIVVIFHGKSSAAGMELHYCQIQYRLLKMEFTSQPITCVLDDLTEILSVNRIRSASITLVPHGSMLGMSLIVGAIVSNIDEFIGKTFRLKNILISVAEFAQLTAVTSEIYEVNIGQSNGAAAMGGLLENQSIHLIYQNMCELRNHAVLMSSFTEEIILAPDILLHELLAMSKGVNLRRFAIGKISVVVPRGVERKDKKRDVVKLYEKIKMEISMTRISILAAVVYFSYFGVSLTSMAATSPKLLNRQLTEINNKMDKMGLENIQSLYLIGVKIRKFRQDTNACSACNENIKQLWQKLTDSYALNFEKYLKRNVYSRLSYLAQNSLGSKDLARKIYLHFKNQAAFLKAKDEKFTPYANSELGEIIEVNDDLRNKLNYIYSVYIESLKYDHLKKSDLILGQSIIDDLSKNKWFLYWYGEYINSTKNARSAVDGDVSVFADAFLFSSRNKHRASDGAERLEEWYYSSLMSKWIARLVLELDPSQVTGGDYSLISNYINNYFNYWFECQEVWMEQRQESIELSECRLPMGKTTRDSILLAGDIVKPIESYISYATLEVQKDIKTIKLLSMLVKGDDAQLNKKVSGMVKSAAQRLLKSQAVNVESGMLGLLNSYKAADEFASNDSNWLAIYKQTLKQGEASDLVKRYLPLWESMTSGALADSMGSVTLIFKRQLYFNLLKIRKHIIDEMNLEWSMHHRKTTLESNNLQAFLEKNNKLISEIDGITDRKNFASPAALSLIEFVAPKISNPFMDIREETIQLTQVMQNNAISLFSEPPESLSGNKVIRSSIIFNCGKKPLEITNDNYRKVYELEQRYIYCGEITLKAKLSSGQCKKKVIGNSEFINNMADIVDRGDRVELDCENGGTKMVDLGFRSNWGIFKRLQSYMQSSHLNQIAY